MENLAKSQPNFEQLLREKVRRAVSGRLLLERKLVIDTDAPVKLQMDRFLDQLPDLKKQIVNLLSPKYRLFVKDVVLLAPKPTIFRVVLINGLDFELRYDGDGNFTAIVVGKRYNLAISGELIKATRSISHQLTLDGTMIPESDSLAAAAGQGGDPGQGMAMGGMGGSTGVFEPKGDDKPQNGSPGGDPSERDPFGGGNVAPDFLGDDPNDDKE